MRAFLLALAFTLVPAVALAEDPPIQGEVIVVHGRPQHPAAFYLLTRARVSFDRAEQSHHALDRIVESVRHAPF